MPDIAVTPDGEVAAVHLAKDSRQVRVASRTAGAWTADVLIDRPAVFAHSSVAASDRGDLAVAVSDWSSSETRIFRR